MVRAAWKTCRWPLILLVVWMVTLTGIHAIPLEDHEVLVLQTTREMESRGDWVLPSFNNEPRLNKPPFNYWATAVLSRLDPSAEDVQVWHGRFISLLAGLLMALATYQAGKTLFDPATGKLASLLLLGMQGFINLSHNARPDFLYSTFGVLQLFAWMHAWKAGDGSMRQRLYGWLGWGMAGLATLTKGPQVPAMFLGGMLLFLACGPDRKRILKVLRPFAGIPLFCALVLPWWILLQQRLEILQVDLSETQLSGSLLQNLAGWKEILSAYYPLTLFSLMLPGSLVIPFLLPRLWRTRTRADAPTRILLYASMVLLVAFTLGGHYRKHYLLPLLPVSALFLAIAARQASLPSLQGLRKRGAVALLASLGVLCLGLVFQDRGYGTLLWVFLCSVPLWFLVQRELAEPDWSEAQFSTQWMKGSLALVFLVTTCIAYFPSSKERWRRVSQSFAESIGRTLHPGDRIVLWRTDSVILPFYAKRPVARFDEEAGLEAYFLENRGAHAVYAVIPKSELAGFSARFGHDVLASVRNERHPEKDLVFAKLTALRVARS